MRFLTATLCALAVAACASTPKRPAAREAPMATFRLGAEAPFLAFDAPGWHRSPGEEKDQATLHPADHKDPRIITVWIKTAEPGSKVEAAMTSFAPLIMAVPVLFADVEATTVMGISDEEALFGFRGVDSKSGLRLTAQFRVKIVSGSNVDYWVMVLAYGPETQAPQMLFDADRIAKSLRIEPAQTEPISPK